MVMLPLHWHIFIALFLLCRKFTSVNGHVFTHFPRRELCAEELPALPLEKCVSVNARRRKYAVHLHTQIICVGSTQKMCGKNVPV